MGAGAGMFEALAGVDTALAKVVQREYEAVNDVAGKFFKKVAVGPFRCSVAEVERILTLFMDYRRRRRVSTMLSQRWTQKCVSLKLCDTA